MNRVRFFVMAIVAAIWILGCATPHLITLKDGETIQTKAEPKLDKKAGFYKFETQTGEKKQLNKDEVRSITRLD